MPEPWTLYVGTPGIDTPELTVLGCRVVFSPAVARGTAILVHPDAHRLLHGLPPTQEERDRIIAGSLMIRGILSGERG